MVKGRREMSGLELLLPFGGQDIAAGVDLRGGRTVADLDRDGHHGLHDQLSVCQSEAQRPVAVLEARRPFILQPDRLKHRGSPEQQRGTGAKPAPAGKAFPIRRSARMPHALDAAALADLGPAAGIQRQGIVPLALILDRVRKPLVQGIGQQVIIGIEEPRPFAAGQRQAGIARRARTGGPFLAHDPGARIGSELGRKRDRRT